MTKYRSKACSKDFKVWDGGKPKSWKITIRHKIIHMKCPNCYGKVSTISGCEKSRRLLRETGI